MFPSVKHIIGQLSVLFTIGAAADYLKPKRKSESESEPETDSIWEFIKSGKEILDFIGDFPDWANFESNLQESLDSLRSKRRELICMEKDLEDELKAVEFQTNGKRKREVGNWQRNVRSKIADVDTREEDAERRNFVFRFLFRAWLGKCVKMEEEEVQSLITRRQALGSGSGLVLDASNGTIEYKLITTELVGKVSSKTRIKIWSMLLNRKVRTLGIVGDEGMGKTTMMANVYNLEVGYSGLFDRAFYVYVREGLDLYQLQAAIGGAMSLLDLKTIDCLSRRATRIHEALKSCGKFLLILDGLSELNEVGIPIEDNGGKLVVVTRYPVVSQKVCEKVVRMEKMTLEDSEELFWKVRTLKNCSSVELSPDILALAKEIIRKCGGVPLMICDTALALKGVDEIFEWRVKLHELQKP
ncbi:LOW QUALITY PROTEIN: hypothetical protein V2J09_007374 [Rumex salicifolius]